MSSTSEQTSTTDNEEQFQPSSLPSPPVSTVKTLKPKLWRVRPPPFPPPTSSSTAFSYSTSAIPCMEKDTLTGTPVLFEDLEHFVDNTTRNEETLLTGAAASTSSSNVLPRLATIPVAASPPPAPQIPNAPSGLLGDDDFTFEANDFILLDDDGFISQHSLFPPLRYTFDRS